MRKFLYMVALASPLLIAQPLQAATESAAEPKAQAAEQQQGQLQQLKQKIESLRNKLLQIQKSTLEGSPELQKQRQALVSLINETAKDLGVDLDEQMQKMQSLKQRHSAADISDEEKAKIAKEFQQARQKLQKVQQDVLSNPEVKQSREDFSQALTEKMKESDPSVDKMMQELDEAQETFRQALMGAMQRQKEAQAEGQGS